MASSPVSLTCTSDCWYYCQVKYEDEECSFKDHMQNTYFSTSDREPVAEQEKKKKKFPQPAIYLPLL